MKGPTCKQMNDLQQKAVFLSAAFQPTPEELQHATRRKYPGPSAKSVPVRETIDIDLDSNSESSDDDMPDISTILKNHAAAAAAAKGTGKAKGKGRVILDSDSDISIDDVSLGFL